MILRLKKLFQKRYFLTIYNSEIYKYNTLNAVVIDRMQLIKKNRKKFQEFFLLKKSKYFKFIKKLKIITFICLNISIPFGIINNV